MVSSPDKHIAALSLAALLAGAALYAVDRPGLPPGLLRSLAGSAPSLLHTFAFTLLTMCLMQRGAQPRVWPAAAFWCALNGGLELLQLPALRDVLPAALARYGAGTFDPLDLLAVGLGAALAAGVAVRRP